MTADLATSYGLLRHDVGAVPITRDVVRARGAEATTFLQGQLSQEVEGLAEGASAWTFVLQPQGKVDSWARVTRVAADELLLDVDGGFGEALVERLSRFAAAFSWPTRPDPHPVEMRYLSSPGR